MSNFKVSFVVPAKKLNLIIELFDLQNLVRQYQEQINKEVSELEIKQVDGGVLNKITPKFKRKRNGKKGGLMDVGKLFLFKTGKGKTFRTTKQGELADFLGLNGYSSTSASSLATTMAKVGLIKRSGHGKSGKAIVV